MARIKLPQPAGVSVAKTQQALQKVARAVDEVAARGSLNLAEVSAKLGDDPLVRAAFENVWYGYTDGNPKLRGRVDPARVPELRENLAKAVARVGQFDADGDGTIRWGEATWARRAGFGERLASDALTAQVNRDPAGRKYRERIGSAQGVVAHRTIGSAWTEENLGGHARTPEGRAAIAWKLRADFVRSGRVPLIETQEALVKAERNPLLRLPPVDLFVTMELRGHLDDGEVKRFLGTDDLVAFAARKKAETEAAIGMPWEQWLEAPEVEGSELLRDPLFGVWEGGD